MAKIDERNGSYTTRASLTDPLTGKRTQKRVTARTKAELRAKVRELENRNEQGKRISPDKTRLTDWLDTWALLYKQSEHSQLNREQSIRLHIKPDEISSIPIGLLRREHIQAFVDRKGAQVSYNTLDGIVTTLRLVLNGAIRRGLIDYNPCNNLEMSARTPTPWTVLDEAQARQLITATADDPLSAFWTLAVTLGIRRGELLGLRWSDVDLAGGMLTIQRTMSRKLIDRSTGKTAWYIKEMPKTTAGRRPLRLPAICQSSLQTHRVRWVERRLAAGDIWSTDDAVFDGGLGGHHRDPNVAGNGMRRLRYHKIVPETLRVHDLRHTAATHMLMNRIPVAVVSRILGHTNPAITYRVYSHVIDSMEDAAIDAIDAQYAALFDGPHMAKVTDQ